MAKKRLFGGYTPKNPFLGLFGPSGPPRGRGFTSTPGGAPGAAGRALRDLLDPSGPREGVWDPVPGSRDRGPWKPREPPRGAGSPGSGVSGVPGAPRVRGFTSTPRAGAPRFPEGVPGSRESPGVPRTPWEVPDQPPRPRPGKPPFSDPGNRGRSHPREAREAVGRGRRAPRRTSGGPTPSRWS